MGKLKKNETFEKGCHKDRIGNLSLKKLSQWLFLPLLQP